MNIHLSPKSILSLFSSHKYLLLILLITFLSYSNIFSNQFIGDDLDFIIHWPQVQSFSHLNTIFNGATPPGHEGTYRPFKHMLIAASYQFFASNPTGYHLVSITTHLLSTLLVYLIILKLSSQPTLAKISSLLFGLHPIHTEAITFITASYDTISILFTLISFYFFLLTPVLPAPHSKPSKLPLQTLSYIFYILALFTNEISLVLPLLLLTYLYLFRVHSIRPLKNYQPVLPYLILGGAYLYIRTQLVNIVLRGTYQADSFYLTFLTSLKSLVEYLLTLLLPLNLSLTRTLPGNITTYTFPKFNLTAIQSQSWSDPSILISIAIVAVLLSLVYFLRHRHPLVGFGLSTLLIGLLPVLNLIPSSVIFSERYAYLSSVGFVIFFSWLILTISHQLSALHPLLQPHRLTLLFASVIALFYFFQTHQRNQAWSDELTLWQHEIQHSPYQSVLHYQLGRSYQARSMIPEAVAAYQNALNLTPNFSEALTSLGIISLHQSHSQQAKDYLIQAYQLDPDNYQIISNLAQAYTQIGNLHLDNAEYPQAAQAFSQALDYLPNHQQAQMNLDQLCNSQFIDCR